MATRPDIHVHKKETVTTNPQGIPGMGSVIAVIGAFDSEVSDVTVCTTKESAQAIFGTSETIGTFKGSDAIDKLFYGASALIIVNTTTWSSATPPVPTTTIDNTALNAALAKLSREEFNILFVADELADASQAIVTAWLASEFEDKYCHGQVAQLQKGTTSAYATSIAAFGDNPYWICTQQINDLSLNESAALMAGYIASLPVNKSLTHKVIPIVSKVNPEYTTEAASIGAKLLELSVPFLEVRNRLSSDYICVNSELPNGLDLYINRVRDYVINRLEAESLLGEVSDEVTMDTAFNIVEEVKRECIKDLRLLKNIKCEIKETNASTVRISLTKLVFDGVILNIDIPYSIEVQ